MKIRFHTLGCKLNYAETSAIARRFEAAGYARAGRDEEAALFVVNSCSVTAEADKKSRNLIRRLHRVNPDAPIVVTGCYAQLRRDEITALEGVTLVMENSRKDEVFKEASALLQSSGHLNHVPVRRLHLCSLLHR